MYRVGKMIKNKLSKGILPIRMMKNKKGWIRILEAFISVMLIAVFMRVLYSGQVKKSSDEIQKIQNVILDQVVNNEELRQDILLGSEGPVLSFVSERLPKDLNFTVHICPVSDICGMPFYVKEVFASERIVSSTLEKYEPRKLKLFVWRE
jgi:hypothetical protein